MYQKIFQIVKKFRKEDGSIWWNSLISVLVKPMSMLISFIYVPVVLGYLGNEKYGIWTTILSILSWIGYFDIGIGNGLRNKLTESIAQRHSEKSRKLVSSAYAFISVLMIVVCLVFCIVATFLDWHLIFGVKTIDENLSHIVSLSVIFITLNFILSICKNVLFALQKSANVSLMELFVQILNLIGVLIISNTSKSSLFLLALIYGLAMIIVDIGFSIYIYSKNKYLLPSYKAVDIKSGMELTSLGMQFFIIQICALVLFTTDNLIISSQFGAADVTPYSTVNKLFGVVAHAFSALLMPVWSSVTKAKVEKNFTWLRRLVKKLHILMIPFVLGLCALLFYFRKLSLFWLGQELDYSSLLIVLGAVYSLLTIWCNTYSYIANGLEMMKSSMIVAIIQAIINIPMSLLFAVTFKLNVAGVLLGTICSMLISAIVTPLLVNKKIHDGIVREKGEKI